MDELHGNRSFADAGSHSLHRAVAHIADGKKAGNICFQQERISIQAPALGAVAVANQVGTRQNESVLVTFDQIGEPIRSRLCADENEHRARRNPVNLAGIRTEK